MSQEDVQPFHVGPYQILESLGRGGMGEVYLAFDPECGRRVALKRIRRDLKDHKKLLKRFEKEAKLTSQLNHPGIVTIFQVHSENGELYYTMPYMEGHTLKQIFIDARNEKKGIEEDLPLDSSIPSLMSIFYSVCQAIAYAHSRGVLNRDIKAGNIIVGRFGQAMILDWGLAKLKDEPETDMEWKETLAGDITRPGKVVGTTSYMAPERVQGGPATEQTDIYALGVLLYQILTLRFPFKRGTLKDVRRSIHKERLRDPAKVAPYRDVPQTLTRIVKRCLAADPRGRYTSVGVLIRDLETYLKGRSDWFLMNTLDVHDKNHWQFQENVLLPSHTAITRQWEVTDWVSMMVSRQTFTGNLKITAKVSINPKSHGVGFLFALPEAGERTHLDEGYCLWMGSTLYSGAQLFLDSVEVLSDSDIALESGKWYEICIEVIDHNVYFYVDGSYRFSYMSYQPLRGTHVGLITRDTDFMLLDFNVYVGSVQSTVSCLAIPDAFLAEKLFEKALSEYRRIGYSFPGRAEGREALFRAGVTLVKSGDYPLALKEFEKLQKTPAAPLEYLGQSLVYRAQGKLQEEIKALEEGLTFFHKHPMVNVLSEQVRCRMHEVSRIERSTTYRYALLVSQHLPSLAERRSSKRLFHSIQKHWEHLPFFVEQKAPSRWTFCVMLAFWLARPRAIIQIIQQMVHEESVDGGALQNAISALVTLGLDDMAAAAFRELSRQLPKAAINACLLTLKGISAFLDGVPVDKSFAAVLCEKALLRNETIPPFDSTSRYLQSFRVWSGLAKGETLSEAELSKDLPLRDFFALCIGQENAPTLTSAAFPTTSRLALHFISGTLAKDWEENAFLWERRQLYLQLALYFQCRGDAKRAQEYMIKAEKEQLSLCP